MSEKQQHINKALIMLFLLILITPTVVQITGIEGKTANSENRKKASFPKINYKNPILFLSQFKSYYKDNFGLRHYMSDAYIKFKTQVLYESPIPSKVVFGKGNFLFLGKSFSNPINESFGISMFTNNELLQIKTTIINRKKWLKNHNIKLYIAVAPNKHSIYKEQLPYNFSELKSRKEQVIEYVKKELNFNIIDLGLQFRSKKQENRLYRKFDSHWNDLGAFYAYETLMDEVIKDFPIKKLDIYSYKIDSIKTKGGISKMLNSLDKENQIILKPLFKSQVVDLEIPKYYDNPKIYESRHKNPAKKFKILLFRDSFASALKPFINETFGECTYIWSHKFDKELILKEKPDIVIIEYIERYLERIKK